MKVNSIVIIDLSNFGEGESFSMVGIVRWVNKVEDDLIGGIELIGNINKLNHPVLMSTVFSLEAN